MYSTIFSCIYDQKEDIGTICNGMHYSVIRFALAAGDIQDLAIMWDEEHTLRIVRVIEHLWVRGFLKNVLFIGEEKGALSIILDEQASEQDLIPYPVLIADVAETIWDVDTVAVHFHKLSHVLLDLRYHYIRGLWELGVKRFNYLDHSLS